MTKTQKEIELNSVFIKEPFGAETPNSKRASFDQKWIVFFMILKIAEIDNPAVNELLNVYYDILCRFIGLRWLTKQQMYVILTKHTKILPRGKSISIIIWV